MVRTAILAGILLVLLAIAADRPGTLPPLPRLALIPNQAPAPGETVNEAPTQPVRKPTISAKPAVVEEPQEEVADVAPVEEPREEPATVAAAPSPAPVAPVADPIAPPVEVATAVPALPAPQPGAPLRLLPPAMEPPAAVPAPQPVAAAPPAPMTEVPVVSVPTRPLFKPVDELPRGADVAQMPEIPAAPAQVAQAQPSEPVKFMSREERSRELYRLAREMENTFMDKLAR